MQVTRNTDCKNVILLVLLKKRKPAFSYDLFKTASTFNCVGCYQPIKALNNRCRKCGWTYCQPDCVGLRNPKLRGIECLLLKGGLGLKQEADSKEIRDYYRADVLFALKCLLHQLKHSEKYQKLMNFESHKEARKTSTNFM